MPRCPYPGTDARALKRSFQAYVHGRLSVNGEGTRSAPAGGHATSRGYTPRAMPSLAIVKKHTLDHAEARRAAEEIAADLRTRFDLAYRWDGDRITFERAGLSGELCVRPDEVRLDCRLGFLLGALKPAIEREFHKEFERRFGTGT